MPYVLKNVTTVQNITEYEKKINFLNPRYKHLGRDTGAQFPIRVHVYIDIIHPFFNIYCNLKNSYNKKGIFFKFILTMNPL